MSNADPRGKFVWHELLTADTAGAGAFYPKVVSWKCEPWERDPSYTLWMGAAGPVGGLVALGDTSASPRWLAYIGVEDVDAAVAQAKSMGATVRKDVTDVPEVGTYAVLADPQGAEFAVYRPHNPSSGRGPVAVGEFSWHELCTSDAEAAVAFYSKLCGWGIGPRHDMGPELGFYHLMLRGGNQYVGIFQSSNMPPGWMCYVKVEDVDRAANAAKSAGGRVINGPMEVPGGSWIAQILDPAGVAFAVHEEKAAVPVAGSAPAAAPKPKARKPAAAAPAGKPAAAAEPTAPAQAPAKKKAAPARGKAPAKAPAKKAAARKAPMKKASGKPARKAAGKAAKKAGRKQAAKATKKGARKSVAKKAAGRKAAKKKAVPMKKKASARKAKKHR